MSANKSIKEFLNLGKGGRDRGLVQLRVKRLTSDKEAQSVLLNYYKLLVASNYLDDCTYAILVQGKSYDEVQEEQGLTKSYIQNRVHRVTKKLFEEIGDNPYEKVKAGLMEHEDVVIFNRVINELISESGLREQHEVLDNFSFDIRAYAERDYAFNEQLSEDEFDELTELMKMLVIPYRNIVMREQIEKEHYGYVVYLLTTPEANLTERDKERKHKMCVEWLLE